MELVKSKIAKNAPDLKLSKDKTKIFKYRRENPQLLPQTEKMKRIQTGVSGGFDAQGGIEILDAIQGLIRTQREYHLGENDELSIQPDVRDVTVIRFSAARFRRTFRSIRTLFPTESEWISRSPFARIKSEIQLDQEARSFAFDLIQNWITDPSNVRLLQIGLDLWSDVKVLKHILSLLKPYTNTENINGKEKLVAWYCLSEVFRAGAIETGLVEHKESLPSCLCIKSYRDELYKEAKRLSNLPNESIPWYLQQQALLFVATYSSGEVFESIPDIEELQLYWKLIQFLSGQELDISDSEFAKFTILTRRSFRNCDQTLSLISNQLTVPRITEIAKRDLSLVIELISSEIISYSVSDLPIEIQRDLCLISGDSKEKTLAREVLKNHPLGKLRNELSLLSFAKAFLEALSTFKKPLTQAITPEDVTIKYKYQNNYRTEEVQISKVTIKTNSSGDNQYTSIYSPPSWCSEELIWRFQLGYLVSVR